jgi:hypothetical protein
VLSIDIYCVVRRCESDAVPPVDADADFMNDRREPDPVYEHADLLPAGDCGLRKLIRKLRKASQLQLATQPWSNGQVEAQITKLKLVKRQMYGRAKLDLFQARLIGAP